MDVGERMARIKSRDTKPEMALRRALHASGVGFRVQAKLPGRPDVAFLGAKVAVFVDGCFWHGCPSHFRRPASNAAFWTDKIRRNQERDRKVDAELESLGWRVLRIWEHEIKADPLGAAARVICLLNR